MYIIQHSAHEIRPLSTHPYYQDMDENHRAKRRCQYTWSSNGRNYHCGNRCAYYCVNCSNGNDLFGVCGFNTERQCCLKHANTD